MKCWASVPILFFLLSLTVAQADSDLCLFGKDRDVRSWLKNGKEFKGIFCKKNAPALKTLNALKKSLLDDGYHLVTDPALLPVPLGPTPAPELVAELKSQKCGTKLKTVYTVCVTLKEETSLALKPIKSLPDQEPPSALKNESTPRPRPTAGKTAI